MKLFSRLYRLNLFATLSIFIFSSIGYYFLIRFVVIKQFDENLQIERSEIEKYVGTHHELPEIFAVKDRLITFSPTDKSHKSTFQTIATYDTVGADTADFRKLFFTVQAGNQWYQAMVGKSMEGTEHLIHTIIAITIVAIMLILLVSSIINRVVLKTLWQPFYKVLQLMKNYQVSKPDPLVFPDSKIEEFNFMSLVLMKATTKANQDYLTLKEFTENASHEMQTPLAIIRSKIDLVIQDEQIFARHSINLQAMYKAIDKLTNLNYSLLFLTKIENNQFNDTREINIREILDEKIFQFEEILLVNGIKLSVKTTDVKVDMNGMLLDALLNNLISNAVKHNKAAGSININLTSDKKLVIGNSGNGVLLDQKKVFTRFYKPEQNTQNTGLGLSIMKHICIASGCKISYHYENDFHFFTVDWIIT
ncbi:sensor histidine kinase [Flavitalea sp.]|nr:HAMP domain-containing sensor histidine kinase [Flavitalea sp.]